MDKSLYAPFTPQAVDATITLFKVVPKSAYAYRPDTKFVGHQTAFANGLIFVENGCLVYQIPKEVYDTAFLSYGLNTIGNNETFHKSFDTVARTPLETLFIEQIAHYLTAYAKEAYDSPVPTFIPMEQLDLPDVGILPAAKFTIINIVDDIDAIEMIDTYLENARTFKYSDTANVEAILPLTNLNTEDIKSSEIRAMKHKMDDTVPQAPVEFLRYLVYRTINQTVLIKNRETIGAIKAKSVYCGDLAAHLLSSADWSGLSSIFLRYKPIFLAFKTHRNCSPIINHLRRLANVYHRPMSPVSLQNLANLPRPAATSVINSALTTDLVKVLNSIRNRYAEEKVFTIRNGKTYVKVDRDTVRCGSGVEIMLQRVILERVGSRYARGTAFYIPDYIDYAVPTSEKQMTGNIPWGTCIITPDCGAFTAGVHWFNANGHRTDIDLHMNSATKHFGWNGSCRNNTNDILFTGDLIDAPEPKGAAEAYYFNPTGDDYILTASLFSGIRSGQKFTFFMTDTKPEWSSKYFTFDPSEAIFSPIQLQFAENMNNMTLGLFHNTDFFFYGGNLGYGVVPGANFEAFIKGLTHSFDNCLTMGHLLEMAGYAVYDNLNDIPLNDDGERIPYIDLSPNALKRDTLFNIINGVK